MFVFGKVSSDEFYQIYLLIFSIVMMFKDLNHVNLTMSDKLLGVASHFSYAVHAWARSVDIDILLMPENSRR